jgi:hypothetical protein
MAGNLQSILGAARGGGASNIFGVSSGSKNYASDSYAAMTRQQWADYISTFVPIENQLIDYAMNPQNVTNAMAEASRDVTSSFDAQAGSTARRLKGLGITLSPEEQAAQQRSFGLAKSLADVGAQNNARDLTVRRQQSVLGNPAPQGV